MNITHIRNATQIIEYAGKKFLIDPMLADKAAWPGFAGTARSELRNPLVALPFPLSVIVDVDAVIVTHTHEDHWDAAAIAAIPKALPVFVQHEADARLLRSQGFSDIRLLSESSEFAGVTLQKTTSGQHGSDRTYAVPAMAERLGEACGVVLRHPQEKTLWLVGDTIWRDEIEADMIRLRPDVVVLNAGYAHVIGFGPIIMGKEDVLKTHFTLPEAQIVVGHMEAVNHCLLSRRELSEYVADNQIAGVVSIPQDGESMVF
ncbi:MBL fold metallo-hydrolase [Raoultella sp. Ech2A]|uniref:MBL fold metallo-hydrolase n=1 Tax=Raoultella sp. Ech2A TaxID=2996539 RepID=UPI0024C07FE6|nr:MBL fold metallo-hydrolase [Raoultella sp. Ech2A]MDJ1654374.1 MBL fold metallo-hydrolase [Raoultella sp. Ech2A]